MQSSSQPGKISLPFANSGQKQPIPVASQIGIEDGRASYTDGFPPITRTPLAAGGKPPFGTDMNGILYAVTAVQQYQNAGGYPQYDSAFSTAIGGYPKNSILQKANGAGFWVSAVENNSTNPDAGGANWLDLLGVTAGVVGSSRNLKMIIASPSSSATLSADELVLKSALGGQSFTLKNFSASINTATTGAGGMVSGLAPASGWLAIYAIYNPATGASSLLGFDSTSSAAPEVFSGSLPAGYTASCLASVWRTDPSRSMIAGIQQCRSISIGQIVVASTTTQITTATAVNISSAIPPGGKKISGFFSIAGTGTNNATTNIFESASGIGQVQVAGNSTGATQSVCSAPYKVNISTQQTIYWTSGVAAGTYGSGVIYCTGYEF